MHALRFTSAASWDLGPAVRVRSTSWEGCVGGGWTWVMNSDW